MKSALVTLGFAAGNIGVGLNMPAQSFADSRLLILREQQGLVFALDGPLDLM